MGGIVLLSNFWVGAFAQAQVYFGEFPKSVTEWRTPAEILELSETDVTETFETILRKALKNSAGSAPMMFMSVDWWWGFYGDDEAVLPIGRPNDLASVKAALAKTARDKVLLGVHSEVVAISDSPNRLAPFLLERAVIRIKKDDEPDRGVEWNVSSALTLIRDADGYFGLRLNKDFISEAISKLSLDLGHEGFWAELTLVGTDSKGKPRIARLRYENAAQLEEVLHLGHKGTVCAVMLATDPLDQAIHND